ncbi:MAG: type III-A CRISPR-associated protein Cas10/Csm1 [Promethearchaeota archaeon]
MNIIQMALLHDIGKFIQRGSYNPNIKTHQEFGKEFLEKCRFSNEVQLTSLFHHSQVSKKEKFDSLSIEGNSFKNLDLKVKNFIWLIWEADNLSSGERQRTINLDFDPQIPLKSIFSLIASDNDSKIKNQEIFNRDLRYFPYRLLFINNKISFFKPLERENEILNLGQNQINLFSNLIKNEFSKKSINILLKILENYLTFIPSQTTTIGSDISLFDHLKTTAAIADCLYQNLKDKISNDINFFNAKSLINFRKTKNYILIGGDLSGIQQFIVKVSTTKGLKMLRAKSLFLDLLMYDIAAEILIKLELSRANLLFCSGGYFYILAPNNEKIIQKLNEIRNKVSKYLYNSFNAQLYVSIDWIELNGNAFADKEITDKWKELTEKINSKKSQKFRDIIFELKKNFFIKPIKKSINKCILCGDFCEGISLEPEFENEYACGFCNSLYHLSKSILIEEKNKVEVSKFYYNAIIRISNLDEKYNLNLLQKIIGDKFYKLKLPFSLFIFVNLTEINNILINKDLQEKIKSIFLINVYDLESDELLAILNKISRTFKMNFDFDILYLPLYSYNNELDALSEETIGLNYIGTLAMDVDNLGQIFVKGIPKKLRTISRLSNLSRFIEYFFKVIIPEILKKEEISKDIFRENPEFIYRGDKIFSESRKVIIIYSGGDDLLLTGAWNDVLSAAFDIKKCFEEYCGYNPHITISGGYYLSHKNFPIYKASQLAHYFIDKAKEFDINKNKLCYFNVQNIDDWSHITKQIAEIFPIFIELDKKYQIILKSSKSFLINIQKILEYNDEKKISNIKKINLLIYLFGKGGTFKIKNPVDFDNLLKKIININENQNQKYIRISTILQWIDYLTR